VIGCEDTVWKMNAVFVRWIKSAVECKFLDVAWIVLGTIWLLLIFTGNLSPPLHTRNKTAIKTMEACWFSDNKESNSVLSAGKLCLHYSGQKRRARQRGKVFGAPPFLNH
jgi:hypothetical protein